MKTTLLCLVILGSFSLTTLALGPNDCASVNCYSFTQKERKDVISPKYLTREEMMYKNITHGNSGLSNNKSHPQYENMTYGNFPNYLNIEEMQNERIPERSSERKPASLR